eukprot:GILK01007755.1.p1 GENE.GILK01007755.1~~GILK01007755.1.p1  ORF type:complete len:396 (+),score=64.06 GILK01007755.1:57-1244(+)
MDIGGLRQRKQTSNGFSGPSVYEKIKDLDVYTKVDDDYKVKTFSGGAVSLISTIIMIILFITEFNAYMTIETVDHIVVDTTRGAKLRINLNVSFPHLTCAEVSLDAMDVSGEQQVDILANLRKQRLTGTGEYLSEDIIHAEESKAVSSRAPGYCGDCFGAGRQPGQCCNTCTELKRAYAALGWDSHEVEKQADQCKGAQDAGHKGEGCNLAGFLEVNKVAGNFHVALGESHSRQHRHSHQFRLQDTETFNASHVIHRLSFGEDFPGIRNPLDGTAKYLGQGTGVYQYFIKLVPTEYTNSRGKTTMTNQFSVTEQFRKIDFKSGMVDAAHALPGVFFIYDLSPFLVQVSERVIPFTHFLTSVCAIVGGVFTVAGIIDAVLYHSSKHITRKAIELAK